MKTAITVLQELSVKKGLVPEYEIISQMGPQHQKVFECQCSALGVSACAEGRSKKEAKQEAAHAVLALLARAGHSVPAEFASTMAAMTATGQTGTDTGCTADERRYVALLRDLCEEYRLPEPKDELVADTGPAHEREFTVSMRVGAQARLATASTKKAAKQRSARALYLYLRDHLRLTDFVEEAALARQVDLAMERPVVRDNTQRPDRAQRPRDYHKALRGVAPDAAREALEALAAPGVDPEQALADPEQALAAPGADPEQALAAAAAALALRLSWEQLPPLHAAVLSGVSPTLTFGGPSRACAAAAAARYLRRAMRPAPPAPPSPPSPR